MSIAVAHEDPTHLGVLAKVVHEGPASKRIVTGYGFWIFLLSDIVMLPCCQGRPPEDPRGRNYST